MKVPVVAAIVVDNGRVLLIRRAVADDRLSWQFPAGKIESGETNDEAAVRETLEETGLAKLSMGWLTWRVNGGRGGGVV